MFKNKNKNGTLNICGQNIARLRMARKISQRQLADDLQDVDIDLKKNAIQQIESGERFVTDVELMAFAKFFGVAADELLK